MKKTLSLLVACFVAAGMFCISCKKNEIKDLAYQGMHKDKYLEAYVNKKGGQMVLWFQVIDRIDDKGITDSYKNVKDKIEKYPAKISKNESICLLVNNRMEIRLTAFEKSSDYRDTDELIKFIKLFDLAGLEQITGPKAKVEELEKFIPKLGEK